MANATSSWTNITQLATGQITLSAQNITELADNITRISLGDISDISENVTGEWTTETVDLSGVTKTESRIQDVINPLLNVLLDHTDTLTSTEDVFTTTGTDSVTITTQTIGTTTIAETTTDSLTTAESIIAKVIGLTTVETMTMSSLTTQATTMVTTRVSTSVRNIVIVDMSDDNGPESGLSTSNLWIPYVVLSLLLVCLMVGSFIRFHKKNGHKYRHRRVDFWRQLNMQNLLSQVARTASSPPNGGMAIPSAFEHNPHIAKPSTSKSGGRKSRRPLVFNSNLNGSMVDVRCGLSDSLTTFRAKPTHSHPNNIWAMGPPRRTGLFSAPRQLPEPSDDEIFLLQQTKL